MFALKSSWAPITILVIRFCAKMITKRTVRYVPGKIFDDVLIFNTLLEYFDKKIRKMRFVL